MIFGLIIWMIIIMIVVWLLVSNIRIVPQWRQNGMESLKNMPNPICEAFKNNQRRSKLFFTRSLSNTPDELQVLNCESNKDIIVPVKMADSREV